MSNIREQIKTLPESPGVYFFKGRKGEILYIGKATSLRDRVRSYFSKDIQETRGPVIVKMLQKAKEIDHAKTGSVLEALILEAEMIRKFKPAYNTDLKDDKSFNYVVITKEEFPRVLLVRERNLDKKQYKYFFGPFTNGLQLKEAMRIVRKIFPFRDSCEPLKGRACFNAQIGLCPGVCSGAMEQKEYAERIKNIALFFRGRTKDVAKNLKKEMRDAAKREEFEKAGTIKHELFALEHIRDVSLLKREPSAVLAKTFRIEFYDIAHLGGKNTVGAMTVVENGEAVKSEYRKFKVREVRGADDTKHLTEVLDRRLAHMEWRLPNLIVVDGGRAQKNAAEAVLNAYEIKIPVLGVVKNEHHQPKAILGDQNLARSHEKEIILGNSESHRFAISYHKMLREKLTNK